MPEAQGRNQSIELVRILGAGAVVWFHLALPGHWAAMAALHVFVILAVYYGLRRPLYDHLRRLMLPWALWSGTYGAAKVAQALVEGTPVLAEFAPWMALTGLSMHLWFLPFTFCALALLSRLHPASFWLPPALMLLVLVVMRLGPYPMPAAQWAHVLPAAVLGLWMAGRSGPLLPLAITCTGAALLTLAGFGRGIEQTAIAAGLCLIAVALPMKALPLTHLLAPLAFGVYLVHPLVVALLMQGGITNPWGLFALTLALSALLSAGLVDRPIQKSPNWDSLVLSDMRVCRYAHRYIIHRFTCRPQTAYGNHHSSNLGPKTRLAGPHCALERRRHRHTRHHARNGQV